MRKAGLLLSILPCLLYSDWLPAQQFYKYRDRNGVWVYTDRQPEPGRAFENLAVGRSPEPAEVRLYRRTLADQRVQLVAHNSYHAPVQIAFQLSAVNLSANVPTSGTLLLQPRSETELLVLERANSDEAMSLDYQYQYIPGSPDAVHRVEVPYRLPYALAAAYTVSQAYPDRITHTDPSSQHAFDFVMPVGTGVYAAREGVVIEVASDHFEAGVDPAVDGPRANLVRVLHDDGTMSLYGHLNWNSIRVVPGQHVARGEYLADSGNTGFSTGPHLHFVVQRNAGGRIVSVPIAFAGAGAASVEVASGDRPVAR
jgi:murein DD-endopeptidase MepM/ murein hydrolase activator NlpD